MPPPTAAGAAAAPAPTDEYLLTRNHHENTRLHAQDWVWRMQLGFVLHPAIVKAVKDREQVRVLDVGCSNGYVLRLSLPNLARLPGIKAGCHDEAGIMRRALTTVLACRSVWLLSLASSDQFDAKSGWSFTGIDISATSFPAPENVPANVEFRRMNAFEPVPADLRGKFDVVHVRAFALVVKGGAVSAASFLRNLLDLLSESIRVW